MTRPQQGDHVRLPSGASGRILSSWSSENGFRSSGHHGREYSWQRSWSRSRTENHLPSATSPAVIQLDSGGRATTDLSNVMIIRRAGSGKLGLLAGVAVLGAIALVALALADDCEQNVDCDERSSYKCHKGRSG